VSALWGAALALIGFVITQYILKFVLEPIQEQRRLIGEVAQALSMYYYVQDVHQEGVEEVRQNLRTLSAWLWSSLWAIPCYDLFVLLGQVPKANDVMVAATKLKVWSIKLATPDPGDSIMRDIDEIAQRLGITVKVHL